MKNLSIFAAVLLFASCSTVQPQIQVIEEDEITTPPPVNVPFTAVFVTNDCKTVRDTAVTFIFTAADSLEMTNDYGDGDGFWTDKTGKIEVVTDKGIITAVTVYPSPDEDLFYQTFFASPKLKEYYETNPKLSK